MQQAYDAIISFKIQTVKSQQRMDEILKSHGERHIVSTIVAI